MRRDRNKYSNTFKVIGQNIRNLRTIRNISQEELAFRISSTRNYIGCIERGEKFPSIAFILDVRDALNCKLTDLFKNA